MKLALAPATRGYIVLKCVPAALLFALVGCDSGGPQIPLRFKNHPSLGKGMEVRTVDKRTESRRGIDDPARGDFSESERRTVAVETTLEEGSPRPARSQLAFSRATVSAPAATESLPYENRTLTVEKRGGRYVVVPDRGVPISPEALQEVEAQLNPVEDVDGLFESAAPVRVGESRAVAVERARLAFLSKAEIDLARSTASCKLTRVYDKDGAKFGVLELRATLKVKTWPGVEFDPPGEFLVEITRDVCIDGSTTAGTIQAKAGLMGTATVSGRTAAGVKRLEKHDVKVLWSTRTERSVEK